jgi:hypothetical protein
MEQILDYCVAMSFAENELSTEELEYNRTHSPDARRASQSAYKHSFVAAVILSFLMAYSEHMSLIKALATAIVLGWAVFGLILMVTGWMIPE